MTQQYTFQNYFFNRIHRQNYGSVRDAEKRLGTNTTGKNLLPDSTRVGNSIIFYSLFQLSNSQEKKNNRIWIQVISIDTSSFFNHILKIFVSIHSFIDKIIGVKKKAEKRLGTNITTGKNLLPPSVVCCFSATKTLCHKFTFFPTSHLKSLLIHQISSSQ